MNITIKLDVSNILNLKNKIIKLNFKKELSQIADLVFKEFAKNFEVEGRPDSWIPSWIVKRGLQKKTLQRTGKLKDSFTRNNSNSNLILENMFLGIGTKVFYSKVHNIGSPKYYAFGKHFLPKRNHVWIPEDIRTTANTLIQRGFINGTKSI